MQSQYQDAKSKRVKTISKECIGFTTFLFLASHMNSQ